MIRLFFVIVFVVFFILLQNRTNTKVADAVPTKELRSHEEYHDGVARYIREGTM